jgi:cob(I)alamin adenosyltransferase
MALENRVRPRKYAIFSPAFFTVPRPCLMVSQLKVTGFSPSSPTVLRHPLLQAIEGTVQVYTSVHRSFFTNVMVQALRTAEQGKPVLIVQFLKGGMDQGPENPMQLGQNLDWVRCALPYCIHEAPVDAVVQQQAVADLWQHTQTVINKGRYGLVVLDELSLAVHYHLIAADEVVALLRHRPPQIDVILTGPAMPESLLKVADQVTEFRRNFLA